MAAGRVARQRVAAVALAAVALAAGAVGVGQEVPEAEAAERLRGAKCSLRIHWRVIALGTGTRYDSSLFPLS